MISFRWRRPNATGGSATSESRILEPFTVCERRGPDRPATPVGLRTKAALAVSAVVAVSVPFVISDRFVFTVIVTGLVTLILNTSWNFVLGIAGVWNFGMLAIYALGGYASGYLMLHTGLPPVAAIVLGGALASGISTLLAFPTLRLFCIYTSLLTFSFARSCSS